ncbi:MAG: hypothetical protein Q4C58_07225 [Eubacteriales bacterium]|nr:hypothetical protein [Eubacteriales bacterium]
MIIMPEQYQLEEDSRLIEKIVNHEVAVKIFDWIKSEHLDEIYNTVYDSSFLRLNDTVAPALMQQLRRACELFGLEEVPPVYVLRDFDDTISIGGISTPFLIIADRYLEMLERERPELLLGVLAAQVGAIQAGHHRGLILSWLLSSVASQLPIPGFILGALDGLINDWKRCRLFTCDRAMYLAVRDYPLALRGILAGTVPTDILDNMALGTKKDAYQAQVRTFMENGALDGLINMANSFLSDTSWLPPRCHALEEFANSQRRVSNGC